MLGWIPGLRFRKPAPEPEGDGPLYGASPPEGCQFRVSYDHGGGYGSWRVEIVPEGGDEQAAPLAQGLAVKGICADTQRAAIRMAAQRALRRFAETIEIAELEGLYPPKRVE